MSSNQTKPRNFFMITDSCNGFMFDPVYVPCEGKPVYWTRDRVRDDLRPATRSEATRFAKKFGRPKSRALPQPVSRRNLKREMRERDERLRRLIRDVQRSPAASF